MNTVAHLFDQFSRTSVPRDDDTPLIQAFGTIGRHLRGPLASLLVFMEVADLYRRSKASAKPRAPACPFRHDKTRQAHRRSAGLPRRTPNHVR